MGRVMGGWGSTRWRGHTRKTIVEECLSFSIGDLFRKGLPIGKLRQLNWILKGEIIACMFFSVDFRDPEHPRLWAHYEDNESNLTMWVDLETTRCNRYGGERLWFLCPECGRRCFKLYLAPTKRCFACRNCRKLGYRSSLESRRDDWFTSYISAKTGYPTKLIRYTLETRPIITNRITVL